jgi:hypothetical protein
VADIGDGKGMTIAYNDMRIRGRRGEYVREITLIASHMGGSA